MKKLLEKINEQVLTLEDANQVSDGYHTFGELYKVRCLLFVALLQSGNYPRWKALRNADGEKWDGWFVAGICPSEGEQITFHLPIKYWERLKIPDYDINPHYDGHSSSDVLQRLEALTK